MSVTFEARVLLIGSLRARVREIYCTNLIFCNFELENFKVGHNKTQGVILPLNRIAKFISTSPNTYFNIIVIFGIHFIINFRPFWTCLGLNTVIKGLSNLDMFKTMLHVFWVWVNSNGGCFYNYRIGIIIVDYCFGFLSDALIFTGVKWLDSFVQSSIHTSISHPLIKNRQRNLWH